MESKDQKRVALEALRPLAKQLLPVFESLVAQGIHPDEVWYRLIRLIDRRGHARPRDVEMIHWGKRHRVEKARNIRSAERGPRNVDIQEIFYRQAIAGIPFKKIYGDLGKRYKLRRRQLQDICAEARAAARRVAEH